MVVAYNWPTRQIDGTDKMQKHEMSYWVKHSTVREVEAAD